MPLIYCAIPDITLHKEALSQPFNPFRDLKEPTQWFTTNNKIALSAVVSSLNPNLPGNNHYKNILNRLDIALKNVASTFDSGGKVAKNKHFAPLLAHANIFCLMVSDICYDKLQKCVTTNDLFLMEPGEFNIVGIYQAPASGRVGDNLPFIIENAFVDASLKAEFLKVCTEAIEESRPTLVEIFKQEQKKYKNEASFTLDNKALPQACLVSSTATSKGKESIPDPVKKINEIKMTLCGEIEKEMQDLLKRNHVTNYDQLNEEKKARYYVIEKLHDNIINIAHSSIQEFNKNGANNWKTTYQERLTTAIQTSLNNNKLDKYNNLEKIGLRLLNIVTILFSPIKRAVTGSWFYSTEGKTKEAVRKTEQIVNESPKNR